MLEECCACCRSRPLLQGERLLVHGDPNHDTYLLLEGRLGVYLEAGLPPLVEFGPGECVGEMSVLTGAAASADVVAEEDSRVLVVPQESLWTLVDRSHAVARNLLHLLADRVRHDNEVIRDHLRRRRALEHDASIDALTGLHNRRWMEKAFPREIERSHATGRPAALLLVDADCFKAFNDRHGHLAGDRLLRMLARVIREALRSSDLAARFGGEEIVLMLPDTDLEAAAGVAERVRQAAENLRITCDGGALEGATVSIGLAGLAAGDTLESILASADEALYRAKRAGRNRVSA